MFENSVKKLNADEEYRLWMNKRYAEFKESLIEVLSQTNAETKRQKHSHVIKVILKLMNLLILAQYVLKWFPIVSCKLGIWTAVDEWE
jgi:hypothetical protein